MCDFCLFRRNSGIFASIKGFSWLKSRRLRILFSYQLHVQLRWRRPTLPSPHSTFSQRLRWLKLGLFIRTNGANCDSSLLIVKHSQNPFASSFFSSTAVSACTTFFSTESYTCQYKVDTISSPKRSWFGDCFIHSICICVLTRANLLLFIEKTYQLLRCRQQLLQEPSRIPQREVATP